MNKILSSLPKTIHTSIAISILLFLGLFFNNEGFDFDRIFWSWLLRYIHVVVAIMWIGLLWYFNFVQIPNMPNIPDDQKPAIGKVIAPAALFYFRWAAFATIVSGLILAWLNGYVHDALILGIGSGGGKNTAIGIVESDPETKAKSAKTAMLFSRTNTLLSLPMLLSMVAAQNLY